MFETKSAGYLALIFFCKAVNSFFSINILVFVEGTSFDLAPSMLVFLWMGNFCKVSQNYYAYFYTPLILILIDIYYFIWILICIIYTCTRYICVYYEHVIYSCFLCLQMSDFPTDGAENGDMQAVMENFQKKNNLVTGRSHSHHPQVTTSSQVSIYKFFSNFV